MKGLVVLMLLALTSLACGTPGGSQVAASPSTTTSSSPTQPTSSALLLVPSSDGKHTADEAITDHPHTAIVYWREYISTDQITVAFSHDGQFLLMVDTVVTGDGTDVRATFQIRQASDGRLLWVPPSALKPNAFNTTMAVWSHMTDRLYFQD